MSSKAFRIVLGGLCVVGVIRAVDSESQAPSPLDLYLSIQRPSLQSIVDAGIHAEPVPGLESYICEVDNVSLRVYWPTNEQIDISAKRAGFRLREGIVSSIELDTDKLSNDAALQLAQELHTKLGIPTEGLAVWFEEAKDRVYSAELYQVGNNNLTPRVGVAFLRSYQKAEPWRIRVEIDWRE